jgi:hypothetical protein
MTLYRYSRRFIDPRDQYRRWIDPRVRALRLADVIAYLGRRGWSEAPSDRPGFRVFQEPPSTVEGEEPFYQFVPESEQYSDYPLRMFELLTGLAEVEDRQASAVIDDILRLANRGGPDGAAQEQPRDAEVPSR